MDFKLKIWRQKNAQSKGEFKLYSVTGIEEDASFLEMLDILNEQLVRKGEDPVAVDRGCQGDGPVSFDHDCREVSAVHAHFILTVELTVQMIRLLPVSCSCVISRMVLPLQ